MAFNLKITIYRTRAKKGRSFYSKIIFSVIHNDAFCQTLSIFTIHHCSKFRKNASILGIFLDAATVQERPLLARVRYRLLFVYLIGQVP